VKLSIASVLYRSAPYIGAFHARARASVKAFAGNDHKIALANDGSPDGLDLAVALTQDDPHVTIVDLSCNFGRHKAMMTGLARASSDFVFLSPSWRRRRHVSVEGIFRNQAATPTPS